MSDHSHDEDHTGPIKTPKQLLLAVFYSFVLPVFIIIGLVFYVTSANKPQAGSSNAPEAVAQCTACHTSGAAGAPKFGDPGAWSSRIAKGYDTLLTSALKGKGAMGAQGGGDFDDLEIGSAVVYMANAGGAKFKEPKKPEAK